MSFDAAAVATLFDRVQSHAMTLALFESVNTHEPKSAPGSGIRCAIWVQSKSWRSKAVLSVAGLAWLVMPMKRVIFWSRNLST